jgi:hypothetical protein
VTDSERLQRQHSESAQVAMRVPARRISHPRVLAMIPALSDAILADLAAVIVSNSEHSNAFREENHNQ